MTSLLHVNVLVSLLDANHEHHAATKGWFAQNNDPWASCPITQNGYLRIVTLQSYSNTISVKEAIKKLSQAVFHTQAQVSVRRYLVARPTAFRAQAHPRAQAVDGHLPACVVGLPWCPVRDA